MSSSYSLRCSRSLRSGTSLFKKGVTDNFTCYRRINSKRHNSSRSVPKSAPTSTDPLGIPLHPTWSVEALLSSYPKPSISPSTLKRLHELSALIPPEPGSEEHEKLMREMEEMVRLVEAVRLVDAQQVDREAEAKGEGEEGVPDGRVWKEGTGIELRKMKGLDEGEVQEADRRTN